MNSSNPRRTKLVRLDRTLFKSDENWLVINSKEINKSFNGYLKNYCAMSRNVQLWLKVQLKARQIF